MNKKENIKHLGKTEYLQHDLKGHIFKTSAQNIGKVNTKTSIG